MNTTKNATKNADTLAKLANDYDRRAATAKESLLSQATALKARLDGYLAGLTTGQYIESEETEIFATLIGRTVIHEFTVATTGAASLAYIARLEGGSARITEAHSPASSAPAAATATVIPSVADKLNRTALADIAPATTSPSAAPKVSAQTKSQPVPAAAPGTVRLVGAAAWNFYSLRQEIQAAIKNASGWPPVKVQRSLQAISGYRKHAELLAWAKKSGLAIVEAAS